MDKKEKEIYENLKKNFRRKDGSLEYSLRPMYWDKKFKEQAKKLAKVQK